AKKCKTGASSIQHFQDKGNKSSTANLHHHAVHCFGEDTVNEAVGGESGGSQSSNIFSTFVSQGQCPVTYSYCAHLTPEFQRVPNNLSFFDLCILVPTLLNGAMNITKLLQDHPGHIHFATDVWMLTNHHAFVTWTMHLEHNGTMLAFLLDIIKVSE
ncbi:hypothetical protein L208DRAFT_1095239, partial [Tricholoma matsutake]